MSRVLLVHQPIDGGVAHHVTDLANGLAGFGYEPITCGPEPLPGADAEHIPLALERNVTPGDDARAVAALSLVVRRVQPKLVHAHSSKAGAVARLTRLRHPMLPVLYTPHGYAFAGYFSSARERLVYREMERALTPLTSRVICVCEAEARYARQVGAGRRVRVVHNGVAALESVRPHTPGPGLVVTVITLLRAGKGIETLIDAIPSVVQRVPHLAVRIYGGGPEETHLRRRAADSGAAASIHFAGITDDPLGAVASADIVAFPSWAESFPYAILEAMAAGRPIIASAVGGIPEAVRDNREALLVTPGDEGQLADRITALAEDSDLRQRLAGAAQRRVRAEFTLEQFLGRTAAVYGEFA